MRLWTACRMTLVLTFLLGVVYPVAMTGLARVVFPFQAAGSLITGDNKIVGSELIGQNFTSPSYFHGRPSAAGDKGYDATSSSGSNLGPTNKMLIDRVSGDVQKLQAENPNMPVPMDLITTSGSGLDPHISPEGAAFQAPRVAKERGMSEADVNSLIAKHTEGRQFGFLGEPRVNVLELNLDLDVAHPMSK